MNHSNKTIWFNQWFSTAYRIITLLQEEKDFSFRILGSSSNQCSVVQAVCDEWYTEPTTESATEYIQFCIDFCEKHKVDLFIPRKNLSAINEHSEDFLKIGTRVLSDPDFEKVKKLNNKEHTYQLFAEKGFKCIPPYYIASNIQEFISSYRTLSQTYNRVCFKACVDEGATTFRIIDPDIDKNINLKTTRGLKITFDEAAAAISNTDSLPRLILMPYIEGTEVSCDCLMTCDGPVIVPRFKYSSRVEEIKFDEEIISICRDFFEQIGYETPCNLQFRFLEDRPCLLEVNTRMSGGIQYSCAATGLNLPLIAVNRLFGKDMPWKLEKKNTLVAYVEEPVLLNINS